MALFPSLSSATQSGAPNRRLRVCIATRHVVELGDREEIGEAYRALAELLASAGHEVTLLCSRESGPGINVIRALVARYQEESIEFVRVPDPEIGYASGEMNSVTRESYFVYCWLKDQKPFDVVHIQDRQGFGYYCLLAKHLGLAFEQTTFCVGCFGPTLWANSGTSNLFKHYAELGVSYMERRSVEFADTIISSSQHLLHWMTEQGYDIADQPRFAQPNVIAESKPRHAEPVADGLQPIREIVFLGRLEPSQGLQIFCDAVQRLRHSELGPKRVIFIGQTWEYFPAEEYIENISRNRPFPVQIETGFSWHQTLEFLASAKRLAVLAPMLANCSYEVRDCLKHGLTFICSDVGGNPELIDPRDHEATMFAPHPASLARTLERVLRDGAVTPRPGVDDVASNQAWLGWHAALTRPDALDCNGEEAALWPCGPAPLVSVCMAHYERPQLVDQALDSVRQQTYPNFEVILVDDGSTSQAAKRRLDELEPEFESRGWKIVRQENLYLGAVRNTGARHARGDYMLFMDDDNIAKPNELEVFVKVAQKSGADILTCVADGFRGDKPPDDPMEIRRIVPLGPAVEFSFFANGFGDSNCFIKRTSFEALGGFSEDYKVGLDDQEFFARATLSGLKLEVVPEALFWYRLIPRERSMKSLHYNPNASLLRLLRPYLDAAPLPYRNILVFAKATFEENKNLRQELVLRRSLLQRLGRFAWKRLKDAKAISRKIRKLPRKARKRLKSASS
jgi:glycosyltransferase involved in cell wall biosynthesis